MEKSLICVIGPDGTGKTTQIELLINYFEKNGFHYKYQWLRFYHFFSLPLLLLARFYGLSEVKILDDGEKIGYHYFHRSKLISHIYPILLFADTFLLIFFKIYLPLLFGKKIICDRFIYDTIVDLMVSTSNYELYKSRVGKLFLMLIPRNKKIFLLISNETTLKTRREDIKKDRNIGLKIELYEKLANEFNLKTIDTQESINLVHEQLIRGLNE
ncbi:hypothetical protein [Methanobacterium formicicum]|uniref:Thymidylate kinase n=1 Tax=Methanobacterium formicicum (strain DSM 3637 / PP1) TaxID=1204725 RepID=K2R1H9_METFP|nr:hypothetical protein [Methanobacterium formicicum]EKF86358.1 hypothetical protein A994_02708 [Methanobacterium formicicum DSM 3637]